MKAKLYKSENGTKYLNFQPKGGLFCSIPVITSGSRDKHNAWTWNGSFEKPTVRPSVKITNPVDGVVEHYWLNDGIAKMLSDCTNGLANQEVKLMDVKDIEVLNN